MLRHQVIIIKLLFSLSLLCNFPFLKDKAVRPDGLSPSFFKQGGELLTSESPKLPGSIWEREEIPKDWCQSLTVSIYKKGDGCSCENQKGVSLVNNGSEQFAGSILHRLSSTRESRIYDNWIPPGPGNIDQICTFRQILECRHVP